MPLRLVIAFVSLSLISCEFFTTRTPEPPEGTGQTGWRFPESPEIALTNLSSAMARRSSADYIRVFISVEQNRFVYRFEPDPGTVSANPGRFDNWNIESERRHSQAMFAPSTTPLDSLVTIETAFDRQNILGDTAGVTIAYKLHVGHLSQGKPHDFEGRSEFRLLRQDDGGWYITDWIDTRSTGQACWSDLKTMF